MTLYNAAYIINNLVEYIAKNEGALVIDIQEIEEILEKSKM